MKFMKKLTELVNALQGIESELRLIRCAMERTLNKDPIEHMTKMMEVLNIHKERL